MLEDPETAFLRTDLAKPVAPPQLDADLVINDLEIVQDFEGSEFEAEVYQSTEALDAFFNYDESQPRFGWLANLLLLGLVAGYLSWFAGLALGENFGSVTDESIWQLLGKAGEFFYVADAGVFVLVAAALTVRFRPPADGLRKSLKWAAALVLVGSIVSVVAQVLTTGDGFDLTVLVDSLLARGGPTAVQAAAALAVLARERSANRVPSIAILGLLVSYLLPLCSGFYVDSWGRRFSNNELMGWLSGVLDTRTTALVAAGVLVSITGWALVTRYLTQIVATCAVAMAVAHLFLDVSSQDNAGVMPSVFGVPTTIFVGVLVIGLTFMPFIRTAPEKL